MQHVDNMLQVGYICIVMLKTYLYIPEELNKQINALVLADKSSKAQVIRDLIATGLEFKNTNKNRMDNPIKRVEKLSRKYKLNKLKDVSNKMDDYLWGRGK